MRNLCKLEAVEERNEEGWLGKVGGGGVVEYQNLTAC
jgi:hypothetical protein